MHRQWWHLKCRPYRQWVLECPKSRWSRWSTEWRLFGSRGRRGRDWLSNWPWGWAGLPASSSLLLEHLVSITKRTAWGLVSDNCHYSHSCCPPESTPPTVSPSICSYSHLPINLASFSSSQLFHLGTLSRQKHCNSYFLIIPKSLSRIRLISSSLIHKLVNYIQELYLSSINYSIWF